MSLIYKPIFSSAISLCLEKDGFLVAAAFQRTKAVLSHSAITGKRDWLRGVKECIITGNLLPAGTTTLNYKSYLDHIYFFKKKQNSEAH